MIKNKTDDILQGAKILIVDDLSENIRLVGTILKKYNASLSIAKDGEQAVKSAQSVIPDIILLDIMMPVKDGFEAAKEILTNDITKDIPIIFLTAKSESDQIVKGFEIGGVDYITKPFEKMELIARIKTHLDLKFKKEALIKSNQEKEKFLSILSHDLKSPFSGILGISEILKNHFNKLSDEEKNKMINLLDKSIHKQYELLIRILEWGKLMSGKIEFYPEKNNFTDDLNNVLDLLELQLSNKKIELIHNIEENILFDYDRNMIQTVLRNLLTNAIKYSYEAGKIEIIHNLTDKNFIFTVKDFGIGMTQKNANKLFEVNNIVSRKGTNNEKGTGLGLLFCRDMIKLHKGEITVKSQENVGTEFTVILPLNQ